MQDVLVEIFGPAGNRHDLLRTAKCDYNPNSGELFAGGEVKIELNNLGGNPPSAGPMRPGRDPVMIETSKVHFTQQATIAETDQPVKFQTPRASGTARGITYSTKTGAVELLNDVVLDLPPRGGPKPMPQVNLTASRLRFNKEEQVVDLWGPIENQSNPARLGELLCHRAFESLFLLHPPMGRKKDPTPPGQSPIASRLRLEAVE